MVKYDCGTVLSHCGTVTYDCGTGMFIRDHGLRKNAINSVVVRRGLRTISSSSR